MKGFLVLLKHLSQCSTNVVPGSPCTRSGTEVHGKLRCLIKAAEIPTMSFVMSAVLIYFQKRKQSEQLTNPHSCCFFSFLQYVELVITHARRGFAQEQQWNCSITYLSGICTTKGRGLLSEHVLFCSSYNFYKHQGNCTNIIIEPERSKAPKTNRVCLKSLHTARWPVFPR